MKKVKVANSQFTLGGREGEFKSLSRIISRAYLLAFSIIAALAIAAYYSLGVALNTQERGLQITKDISLQRMLSQRISLLAMRLAVEKEPKRINELKGVFKKSISDMTIAHLNLTSQTEEWDILTKYRDENRDAYLNPPIKLDQRVRAFLASAKRLAATPNPKISLSNPEVSFLVTAGGDSLLESLDYAVRRYDAVTRSRISFVQRLELLFLVGTLVILTLEGWLVFRPMARKLRESTDRLNKSAREIAAVIETVGEGILTFDSARNVLGINREVERLWHASKTDLIGSTIDDLFTPLDTAQSEDQFSNLADESWVERKATALNGEVFPVEVNQKKLVVDGTEITVMAIRDTRQQKAYEQSIERSLEEKKVLLQEIHHRVKNNLQIISSFLSLQSRYLDDERSKGLFQESRNRVDTMALIHEELYKSKDLSTIDFGSYIRDLTNNLFLTFGVNRSQVSLEINAKGILFNIDTAVPCGLIINELVANSLEHAFRNQQNGKITIEILPDVDHTWKLSVSDNGVGMDPSLDIQSAKTMGLRLVRALTKQIDGELHVSTYQGTTATIVFSPAVNPEVILKNGASATQRQGNYS
jgi:PAS domain S-box-containing protein